MKKVDILVPKSTKIGQIDSISISFTCLQHCRLFPWNNGKSGAKLDLTTSTTTGLQIHTVDHTRTPCRHAALLLVGCPLSLVYFHLPVVEGLIFCISATPHLGTSFPLFHGYFSNTLTDKLQHVTMPM